MRILLVEDDPMIGQGLVTAFTQQQEQVEWVQQGEHALLLAKVEAFDVIVLDLGLPGMDGLDILREYRRSGGRAPCLILTARDSLEDKVSGLDLGADDYLAKPFELAELKARIRAITRRASGVSENLIRWGALVVNTAAHTATLGGKPLELSRREYDLLYELLLNRGRVMTRDHLEQLLYGFDDEVASNALEVHIHHLRKKIGKDLIRTVRGVGYTISDRAC